MLNRSIWLIVFSVLIWHTHSGRYLKLSIFVSAFILPTAYGLDPNDRHRAGSYKPAPIIPPCWSVGPSSITNAACHGYFQVV